MTSPQARLDKIQTNTLECMNIAADVMELLQTESHDAPSLKAKCEHFLNKIIESQVHHCRLSDSQVVLQSSLVILTQLLCTDASRKARSTRLLQPAK